MLHTHPQTKIYFDVKKNKLSFYKYPRVTFANAPSHNPTPWLILPTPPHPRAPNPNRTPLPRRPSRLLPSSLPLPSPSLLSAVVASPPFIRRRSARRNPPSSPAIVAPSRRRCPPAPTESRCKSGAVVWLGEGKTALRPKLGGLGMGGGKGAAGDRGRRRWVRLAPAASDAVHCCEAATSSLTSSSVTSSASMPWRRATQQQHTFRWGELADDAGDHGLLPPRVVLGPDVPLRR
jgi:hypothetical protein